MPVHRTAIAVASPSRRAAIVLVAFVAFLMVTGERADASRTINSVTLNGSSSVSVAPGATITAAMNVTTTGSGSNNNWYSSGWRISTTPPGSVTCENHGNHGSSGTYNESFSITAPVTPGTYNAYFIAYNNDSCSSGSSSVFTLTNAVVVQQPATPTPVNTPTPASTPTAPANPPRLDTSKDAVALEQCQEAKVTLQVTGAGDPVTERLPLDVMLVLDRSGSMSGQPISDAKSAAKSLVDQLDSIDRPRGPHLVFDEPIAQSRADE